MIPMYKDGKQCMAEKSQIAAMENGGWSRSKEAPKPVAESKPKAVRNKVTVKKTEE